jgi:subtilisin family serine protease
MREHQGRWRKVRFFAGLCLALSVVMLGVSASGALGATPNDLFFPKQWADSNGGQWIPLQEPPGEALKGEAPGTPGADVRATEAWRVTTGSRSIVIGEVDTGVNYTHADLEENIWNNPEGKGGCLPGKHGYNVLGLLPEEVCNPMDTENEGYGGRASWVPLETITLELPE